MGKLANAVGYQMVWLVSIVGAVRGSVIAGPLAATAFVAFVLAFGGKQRADLRLIPLALPIGLLTDSAWIGMGWLHYDAPWPSAQLAPAWIIGIWMSFALTLNHSMAFLKGRHALAALLGAVCGPLAYWGASRGFGAVHFDAPAMIVLLGIGIVWTAVFPLLVRSSEVRGTPITNAVLR
jgi:hypothetical protein